MRALLTRLALTGLVAGVLCVTAPTSPAGAAPVACVQTLPGQVSAKKLSGSISSPAVGCRSGATVTLWRQKKGADRQLVVLPTKTSGTFRTGRPARAGRYYVTVASPEQPLCARGPFEHRTGQAFLSPPRSQPPA